MWPGGPTVRVVTAVTLQVVGPPVRARGGSRRAGAKTVARLQQISSSSNEMRGMAHSHRPVKHQLQTTSYKVQASCAREETSLSRRSASQQQLNTTG
ncbi:hypothetical protein CPLU01_07164 [Colletotrichum plurivorum]|uniref:Uncharacterized protein n=1 Tax=Colletotrichum plurivorum TaxID=2175906 RepID=A0A8H6KFU8_9PEZI|nr:hypothetical protein CPLU01_07164 [Colletotrichum plurivorum]